MTGPPVQVRVAGPDEVPVLAAFRRTWDTWVTSSSNSVPGSSEETEAEFDARFADWFDDEQDHRTFWIAWSGATPIGLSGLLEYRSMPTPGLPQRRWGYLGNMYVAAEHRNRGVGGLLLDAVIAAAEQRGYRRVVLAPSVRSIPFYRRAGFVDAGPDAHGDRLLVRPL